MDGFRMLWTEPEGAELDRALLEVLDEDDAMSAEAVIFERCVPASAHRGAVYAEQFLLDLAYLRCEDDCEGFRDPCAACVVHEALRRLRGRYDSAASPRTLLSKEDS